MEKLAIIGNGVIGATLANYIDTSKFEVTVFDEGVGQATKASAGIISPWLSKRRNKKWYALARDGAAFFPKLQKDLHLNETIYKQSGTLLIRSEKQLESLQKLAESRRSEAPEIGDIRYLSAQETSSYFPLLAPQPSLHISGGGRLDGKKYLNHLENLAKAKGIHFVLQKATLSVENEKLQIRTIDHAFIFDKVALTAGPHLPELLASLELSVDIRPQKGQLLVFDTPYSQSGKWPVAMLDGEADLIPFENGKIILGATHENEARWDLAPTKAAFKKLTESSQSFLKDPQDFLKFFEHSRVGTRAYTVDFAPFFGPLPKQSNIVVASDLGSSGLTTGPYIGYLLAEYFNHRSWSKVVYQKPIETYLQHK